MHLFVTDLEDTEGVLIQQNKQLIAGNSITAPCFSPVGYLGLSVSYDLRFPELYRKLTLGGAQILIIPSSFTVKEGSAHFETLMRTRAIEN
jgi:predicted amidohydrolase